jgi:alkyl hydroperoxide reductase subunit F
MRDVIIIGGGPAGCTAGIYSARKKLDTLLIAKDFTGQIGHSSWVENYPGFKKIKGLDLAKSFKSHLESFAIDINEFEEVKEIRKYEESFTVLTDEGEYNTRSVIICSGAKTKKLGIPNEEKFLGKGISYCVTCDESSFEGKDVAVVGGGNAGVEAAIELTSFAKKVYLLECEDRLSADEVLVERLRKDGANIITACETTRFEGEKELKGLIYMKDGREKVLEVDGCFIEIGRKPNTDFVKSVVDLNDKGEIVVDTKTFETSVKGIFAAGDVVDFKDKQVVIATGQGAVAALSAYRYLERKI